MFEKNLNAENFINLAYCPLNYDRIFKTEFFGKNSNFSIGGASVSLMGGIGYLAATEPAFPNYIFHAKIDGEHIALYLLNKLRLTNLVLEVII